MSDIAGTPAGDTAAEDPSKREAALSALTAWGEEVKQQIATAIDTKLNELGQKLQDFGS